jgi:hypothetical protein
MHDLARLGHAGRVADQLTGLESEIEGDLIRARAYHARALATNDPEDLEVVAVAFESMGAFLRARRSCRRVGRVAVARAREARRGRHAADEVGGAAV